MKKNKFLPLISILFCFSLAFGQSTSFYDCENLNKTIHDPANTDLLDVTLSIEGPGFIRFDMEKLQEEGGISDQTHLLGINAPNTFKVVRTTIDQLNPEITYVQTQQYYNGLLVEGGGYTQGFINCFTYFINAYIMEDIDLDVSSISPSFSKDQVLSVLQNHEKDSLIFTSQNTSQNTPKDGKDDMKDIKNGMELVIDKDLSVSCDYVLAWKARYMTESGMKAAYVNTSDGTVYKELYESHGISANTANYGMVNLNDYKPGSTTSLRTPDNSVRTFDKSNTNEGGISSVSNPFPVSQLPTTTANSWPVGLHESEVYQAHYVTTNSRDELINAFSFQFPATIFVGGHMNFEGARIWSGNDSSSGLDVIGYGRDGNKSFACMDIAAHELTHIHLAGSGLNLSLIGEPSVIEEAICDMFGESVEKAVIGSNDWVIGGDSGIDLRDMSAPPSNLDTYQEIDNSTSIYHKAAPMNKWFYEVAIALGINNAISIVRQALNSLNSSSGYLDMRNATIMATEQIYSECSWQVKLIAQEWYDIGVGNQYLDCIYIAGPVSYCEEGLGTTYNVDLLMQNPQPGMNYVWQFPYDWTAIGQSTPQTFNGTHLRIINYGTMTWFPRYFTVKLKEKNSSTNVVEREESLTITIKDCQGDDPPSPCDDIPAEADFLIINQDNNDVGVAIQQEEIIEVSNNNILRASDNTHDDTLYKLSIYNTAGQLVRSENLNNMYGQINLSISGLYIVHIIDEKGETVQVEKLVFTK